MAQIVDPMCFIKEVAARVEQEYPLSRAETSWDNVGVLLEFASTERKVLLCIDLTHQVLDECRARGINNVLAYHPVIFSPIKKINRETPLLHRCLTMGISVYTPHSALDGGHNGINAWLGGLVEGSELVDSVGAIQVFRNRAAIREVLAGLSAKLGLGCVRYALGMGHSLATVPDGLAAGCGSNGRALKKLVEETAGLKPEPAGGESPGQRPAIQLAITGEAAHHDLLYLTRAGVSVVLLEHSRSERGFLPQLKALLEANLQGEVEISEADRDPVEFFHVGH